MAVKTDIAGGGEAGITLAELHQAMNAADPRAFFVAPRVLRRVIKHDRQITSVGLQAPHRKSYMIAREPLLAIVDRDELNPVRQLPDTVILLAQPDAEQLASLTREDALLRSWRLLYHASIHVALDARLDAGELTPAAVRERIHRIGQAEFDEIRNVLRHEEFLLPPRDDPTVFVEFAAVFLELRHFAPPMLAQYFPGIDDVETIEAILAEDVDGAGLLKQTRPEGAPHPSELTDSLPLGLPPQDAEHEPEPRSQSRFRKLTRRAQRVAELGNVVRAAILRTKAAELTTPKRGDQTRLEARADIDALVRRLRDALNFGTDDAQRWRSALLALLEQCPRGVWTAEARLLYDLQKVCVDFEREIYTVDLVGWIVSLGRQAVRRPLPSQREVLMCKHLRGAAARLAAARISDRQRRRLGALLGSATQRAESSLRDNFRPRIRRVLENAGLTGENLAERVSRKKVVEELLDQIVRRGFLTLGDLRDAVSRNRVKIPDLTGARELWRGDRLLRTNEGLARGLDGVYHPAEVYLRWLQRLSAAGFGTRLGRAITKYVVLPFGAAFVVIVFFTQLPHLLHLAEETALALSPSFLAWWGTLGLFFFGLVNSPAFRWQMVLGLKAVHKATVAGIDLMVRTLRLPQVRRFLRSRWFMAIRRYLLRPLIFSALALLLLVLLGADSYQHPFGALMIFLGMNVVVNSRLGRDMEEITNDWAVNAWRHFQVRVLSGLFYLIVDLSRAFLEAVDRLLYAVDEWLRFKSGESAITFGLKAVMGVVWFVVTYVLRFCINLLIEPQINPIKHFPVVTVSHKLLLPTLPFILEPVLTKVLGDKVLAETIAWAVTWGIPGVFGFLVWELKENWRLYAANRPEMLQPCRIGHHGETMLRFMKPGIHSGTLPKTYKKLRRAERKAQRSGHRRSSRKYLEKLSEIKHVVRQFVQRELVVLLEDSRAWSHPLTIGDVAISSNSIRVELLCSRWDDAGVWIAFEEQSGWLLGSIAEPGWIGRLDADERDVFRNALLGLYKLCGVDLVRQQIEACFHPRQVTYDISREGLVVWPEEGYQTEVVYDLEQDPLEPHVRGRPPAVEPPTLSPPKLFFKLSPIAWSGWVSTWEEAEQGHGERLVQRVHILPANLERVT